MKKLFIFLLLSIFLVQSVSALTFLNIFINDDGQATFVGETTDQITFPTGIELRGSNVLGKTQSITNKQGEIWSVSYSLPDAEMNIILPKGAVIKSLSNGEISVNKNQISIFVVGAIDVGYTIDRSLVFSSQNQNSFLIGLVLAVILIILIVFLINYSKREMKDDKKIEELERKIEEKSLEPKIKSKVIPKSRDKAEEKLKLLSGVLSNREKLILKVLKKSGKVKQSYLRKLTKIPKASFSRHIQELEKKKIIKRSGEGKNKFVEITS